MIYDLTVWVSLILGAIVLLVSLFGLKYPSLIYRSNRNNSKTVSSLPNNNSAFKKSRTVVVYPYPYLARRNGHRKMHYKKNKTLAEIEIASVLLNEEMRAKL